LPFFFLNKLPNMLRLCLLSLASIHHEKMTN
jgi:hypothetical protein